MYLKAFVTLTMKMTVPTMKSVGLSMLGGENFFRKTLKKLNLLTRRLEKQSRLCGNTDGGLWLAYSLLGDYGYRLLSALNRKPVIISSVF